MKANGLLIKIATIALASACAVHHTKTADLDAPNGIGLNGIGLNGIGLNGIGLNGIGLNGIGLNGIGLNGIGLNGIGLNGIGLNGIGLNGIGLNGIGLNGIGLNGIGLNGVGLLGVLEDGTVIGGYDFIGATLTGNLSDGSTLTLQIDNIEVPDAPNDDVYLYYVSYQTTDGWQPLCGNDADGNPVAAVALNGVWNGAEGVEGGGSYIADSTQFTFGCRNKALGKCVLFGYKPWKSIQKCDSDGNCTVANLADYHQACTRMVRADYCGNGKSWTQNGRVIDLYDGLDIETDTDTDWQFEAEWTPNGASCVVSTRILWSSYDQCVLDRTVAPDSGCGNPSDFSNGTLLMERYQTQGTEP